MGKRNHGFRESGVFPDNLLVTDSAVISESYVRDSLSRGQPAEGDGDIITGVKYGMLMGVILWAIIVFGLKAIFQ